MKETISKVKKQPSELEKKINKLSNLSKLTKG